MFSNIFSIFCQCFSSKIQQRNDGTVNFGANSYPKKPLSLPSTSSQTSTTKITTLEQLLLLTITSILYLNSLPGEFAYDDSRAIIANEDLRPSSPWTALLFNDFWGTPIGSSNSHGSYRPVTVATFRLNYHLHGLSPLGYHLVNLLLHLLVTALYIRLLSCAKVNRRITLLSGLLFASHPIHVEAVSSVVGRADLVAGAFYLASLLCYVQYVRRVSASKTTTKSRLLLYGSLAFAALSMFSKEHGITVLGVSAYYHLFVVHRFFPSLSSKDFRLLTGNRTLRRGLLHLTFAASFLLLFRLVIISSTTPTFAPADNPAANNSHSVIVRLLTFLYLPSANFWLLIHPQTLSFDWSMEAVPLVTGLADWRNLISICFYGCLVMLLKRVVTFYHRTSRLSSPFAARQQTATTSKDCSRCESHFKALPRNNHDFVDDNNNNDSAINYNHFRQPINNTHVTSTDFDDNNNDASVPNRNNSFTWSPSTEIQSSHLVTANTTTTLTFNLQPAPFSKQKNFQAVASKAQNHHSTSSSTLCRLDCLSFSLALTIIPFLPASNLFFYVGFVIAERILYIPSFGYCLFLAVAIEQCLQRVQRPSHRSLSNKHFFRRFLTTSTIYASIITLLVAFSLRTVLRNVDWLTEENLYRSGVAVNPPKAYGNLGNILKGQGKVLEAEAAYRTALSYRQNMADVHYNLGLLLQESGGREEEALASYQHAIRYRPRLALAHLNLATVLVAIGQKEEAKAVYRRCADLDSTGLKDVKVHENARIGALYNLARLYAETGHHRDALEVLQEALGRAPSYYASFHSLFNVLGEVHWKLGASSAAEAAFKKALEIKRDHIPAHLTYAKMLAALNRTEEADGLYRRALVFSSNESIIYLHYAQFTSNTGNLEYALELYHRGLARFPANYDLLLGVANTLRELRRNEEAEKYYLQSATARPEDLLSWSNLGAIYHLNGKYELAMEAYQRALMIRPDDAITRTNLAKLKTVMGSSSSKA